MKLKTLAQIAMSPLWIVIICFGVIGLAFGYLMLGVGTMLVEMGRAICE